MQIKPQQYKDPRPPELFDRFHERARTRDPDCDYELVRLVTTPISLLLYRTRAIEVDNVPATGPVILAANHFSNFDHFLAGAWLRRKIRFLAKSQMFGKNPVLDTIYTHGGVFPVRRGHADEEAFETMHAILRRGRLPDDLLRGRALPLRASSARRDPASAGPRSRPARRSFPSRSTAPRESVGGGGSSSRR